MSHIVVGPQDAVASATAASPSASAASLPPSRAWRTALENIEARLLSGELEPGDHLPSERQLAAELGVARSSVREAIRVLEVLGLVRTATGSGPSAGAIIVSSPDGGLSAVMRLHVAAQGFPVADVVEARLVVEPAIAAHLATTTAAAHETTAAAHDRHAARSGSGAPDLARASALLDAMDADGLTPAEFLALDARFHVALAEASGNTVLSATMAGLRDSIEGYVLAAVPNLPSWVQTSARLRAEHRAIVHAITTGDAMDAAARVRAHVAAYHAESRLTGSPPATDHPPRRHKTRSARGTDRVV
ncbi:FadR/GntR family transcriptional regulator [Humibacter ginsenosidimutans]|uniref:FadR family transcriptional regulator n=1 Tax=Humibacter ginsenosidimutans TaxID=2599293 RepID=A0A5B8M532_9MICO|nr:GntR family transcriptional regulator [Humibacter ginsenosidimutans]QDZ15707.1 FadR family transcriptional regulator [Humibacter ginsenosidimutans]